MSLRLNILRHAKSCWAEPGVSDWDRALNKRGLRDAPRMGAALAGRMNPCSIHASSARRAQMTLEGLLLGWPMLAEREHVTEEDLYTFSLNELLRWIRRQDDAGDSLFMLGHNPGLTALVNYLCGLPVVDNLPTAGFACLSLDADCWSALTPACAELEYTLFPRELASD